MIRFLLRPVPHQPYLAPTMGSLLPDSLHQTSRQDQKLKAVSSALLNVKFSVAATLFRLSSPAWMPQRNCSKSGSTAQALTINEDAYSTIPDLPLAQEIKSYARQSYLNAGLIRAQELMNQADYSAAAKIFGYTRQF